MLQGLSLGEIVHFAFTRLTETVCWEKYIDRAVLSGSVYVLGWVVVEIVQRTLTYLITALTRNTISFLRYRHLLFHYYRSERTFHQENRLLSINLHNTLIVSDWRSLFDKLTLLILKVISGRVIFIIKIIKIYHHFGVLTSLLLFRVNNWFLFLFNFTWL